MLEAYFVKMNTGLGTINLSGINLLYRELHQFTDLPKVVICLVNS